MDKIITILGQIVIALGGAGAIIIALSSFVGKLWSDKYMKKKTAEYDKKLEYYKNSLELERDKYKALYEQIVYNNKALIDNEYGVYKELLPKVINALNSIDNYIYSNLNVSYLNEWKKDNSILSNTLAVSSIFIDKEIFEMIAAFQEESGKFIFDIAEDNHHKYKDIKGEWTDSTLDLVIELTNKRNLIKDHVYEILDCIRSKIREKSEI